MLILILLFSTLTYAFTKANNPLNRLDEITEEIAKLNRKQMSLNAELLWTEMQIADNSGQIEALKDEASSIFMKMIYDEIPEVFEETEETSEPSELWESTIGVDVWPAWYPGKLTEDGSMQELPPLASTDSHQRFKELCEDYGIDASFIYHLEDKYGLIEGLLPAILIAETSGWHNGNYVTDDCWNLGNVSNNDRWTRVCFDTKEESIEQVAMTLNNKYLGWVTTLGCLSNAGNCLQKYDTGYRYATSNWNWERNVKNVLEHIYMTEIDPVTFIFRK